MLDRKLIRKNPEYVKEGIRKKDANVDLDAVLALDERMRSLLQETESLKHERNVVSQEISRLKKENEDVSDKMGQMKKTSARIKEIDGEIKRLSEELDELLLTIPNIPHKSVPYGTCPDHNVEIRRWGELEELPF